jgi:hypothetical protein
MTSDYIRWVLRPTQELSSLNLSPDYSPLEYPHINCIPQRDYILPSKSHLKPSGISHNGHILR